MNFAADRAALHGKAFMAEKPGSAARTAHFPMIARLFAVVDGLNINENYIEGYTNDQLFFISYAQG